MFENDQIFNPKEDLYLIAFKITLSNGCSLLSSDTDETAPFYSSINLLEQFPFVPGAFNCYFIAILAVVYRILYLFIGNAWRFFEIYKAFESFPRNCSIRCYLSLYSFCELLFLNGI